MMISCPIIKTHRLLIRPISNIDNIEFFNLLTNPLVAEIAGVDENININATPLKIFFPYPSPSFPVR